MQRIILQQLKDNVHRLEGAGPPDLARYYRKYKREFRAYQKISNKAELIRDIAKADIVFGGDFHAFAQSQRTHLRILRELIKQKRPVALAFESVNSSHQKYLDLYLTGRLSDGNFLKKIDYFDSWGFPWENYKILFDFAKAYGLPVFGLNKAGRDPKRRDLISRDIHGAKCIAELRRAFPSHLIYVIYGDLHLARSHLPGLTRKYLGRGDSTRFLTIFQNSETLYWQLARRRLEEKVDVLKLRPDAYCVVNSPPWLKWQAYLNFLENALEPHQDEHKEALDMHEQIFHFIEILKNLWKIQGSFVDFHVYGHGDAKMASHASRVLNAKEFKWVQKFVAQDKDFFIPKANIFYLAHSDVNHGAALAGAYIHSKLRREKIFSFKFPEELSAAVWVEAIGFFASKLVNSHRKLQSLKDLPPRHQVTLIVLEQRLKEQLALKTQSPLRKSRRRRGRRIWDYYQASRVLGALLGNRIYRAFLGGDLNFLTLQRWLRHPVHGGDSFTEFYLSVLAELPKATLKEQSKDERL